EAGKLPGWTLLVTLLGCAISLMILLASRHFGLSWWIGVRVAIAVTVASVFLNRAIECKHARRWRTK
ncbi:hypothetical protein, partial [Burkholderia vietnamiensis]|uniref:hypothetical protein n=1 Tax=Burkholderia vietnamiensis TaxID=60552 RepID=UPI00158D9CDD